MKHLKNNENDDLIILCKPCLDDFRSYSIRKIRRTKNPHRESCTYCSTGMGWEYKYTDKKGCR
ncbi:MAG: hypothetical protein LBC86_07740 [Oscillospiraceae bacterium]|nr:hypothetical protein [Oscillospiraceae bacterium]